jgi:hypothetical protein
MLDLVLWCLMSLSTIFHLYRGGQFYLWRKPEDPEKTTQTVIKGPAISLFMVTIVTDVVSSNLDQGEVYNIM